MGCSGCHLLDRAGRGPSLRSLYGSRVQLTDGKTVQADDAYIRESILNPNAKVLTGYRPNVMPSFQGQISEEGILQLVVYIKSLAAANAPGAPTAALQPALIAQPVSVARRAGQPDGGKQ
jgi:cytochrome c oxidase subunit 2